MRPALPRESAPKDSTAPAGMGGTGSRCGSGRVVPRQGWIREKAGLGWLLVLGAAGAPGEASLGARRWREFIGIGGCTETGEGFETGECIKLEKWK